MKKRDESGNQMVTKAEVKAIAKDPEKLKQLTLQEIDDMISDIERVFCNQYMIHFNGARAAKEAGYTANNGAFNRVAMQLLARPLIVRYLTLLKEDLANRLHLTKERVVGELANIAFFNVADLYDDEGKLLPGNKIPRHATPALTSIKERVIQTLDGGEKIIDREYKISNRETSLDMLAKHLGLYEKDNGQRAIFAQMIYNMPHNGRNTELIEKYNKTLQILPQPNEKDDTSKKS